MRERRERNEMGMRKEKKEKKREGGARKGEKKEKEISCFSIVLEVSLSRSFEGMGGLNVTDVRIPLLWSTVRES